MVRELKIKRKKRKQLDKGTERKLLLVAKAIAYIAPASLVAAVTFVGTLVSGAASIAIIATGILLGIVTFYLTAKVLKNAEGEEEEG